MSEKFIPSESLDDPYSNFVEEEEDSKFCHLIKMTGMVVEDTLEKDTLRIGLQLFILLTPSWAQASFPSLLFSGT